MLGQGIGTLKKTEREENMSNPRNLIGTLAVAGGIAVTMLALSGGVQAAEVERTASLEKLLKAAQAEGPLNVIWGNSLGRAKGAKAFQDGINKAYGINIKINYTPGPSMPRMASRLIQEFKAGRKASTDLYIGVEVSVPGMIKAGALRSVPWSDHFPYITPAMQVKNGYGVQILTLFNGIHYNTEFIKPHEVPKKMADVFKPKWKGKIASTPYAAVFDRLALIKGIDVMRPIVKKTAEWAGGLIRCSDYERLASGEFLILFLDCGRTDERLLRVNGGPLEQKVLDDALTTTLWYLSVPTHSKRPNLAALYAGFVMSRAGQDILAKLGNSTSHLISGTRAYKEAKAFEARGLKIQMLTPDDLLPVQKQLITYKREFQKTLRKK